jgi:hypothetical protein
VTRRLCFTFMTLLIGVTGCTLPTPVGVAQPGVLIEYHRSGGFAGLNDQLTIMTDGKALLIRNNQRYESVLDPERLQQLQQVLEDAHFSTLEPAYLPQRQGTDLISYEIRYAGQRLRTADAAVPDALQPVLDLLNETIAAIQ